MDIDRFLARVGENLRKARQRKGLTLEQATAGRGGYRYLWEVEAGRRNPSLEMLHRLGRLYGVTVSDLTDVPGARNQGLDLTALKVEGPKRGRPKKKGSAPGKKKLSSKRRTTKK